MINPVLLAQAQGPSVFPLPATPAQMVALTFVVGPALLVQDPAPAPSVMNVRNTVWTL